MAPPHTRGSTSSIAKSTRSPMGSPAHAGIDLGTGGGANARLGLPRTRGDRPRYPVSSSPPPAAPPHTRGSTPAVKRRSTVKIGSPAHAGIDPGSTPTPTPGSRLPRTRGDRPYISKGNAVTSAAPPHTRGSTLLVFRNSGAAFGSPAHAGIDLASGSPASASRRLPRTRGDRPAGIRCTRKMPSAPPHTRGSTRPRLRLVNLHRGSPAHAGIDLARLVVDDQGGRLPRTRGDRPHHQSRRDPFQRAPPHTRGSTLAFSAPCEAVKGSPAHAGIDLLCPR